MEIFFKFFFFFLAGREGISPRASKPEGVYFYERAGERLATACLPPSLSGSHRGMGGEGEVC